MPRITYPPYITPVAKDLLRVDPPPTRRDLAAKAVDERIDELVAYRRSYYELHEVRLDVREHEHEDQALAELRDLRDRTATAIELDRQLTA